MAWDTGAVTAGAPMKMAYSITVPFASTTFTYSLSITNVYAPADHCNTDAFLADLHAVAPPSDTAWLVIGDFNLTRSPEDKNTANFDHSLADKFNAAINSLSLIELPLLDRLYTWSNKHTAPTLARLDWAFMNNEFAQLFPHTVLNSRIGVTSDHVPLVLSAPTSIPKMFHFRFENAWLKHPSFLLSVLPAWSEAFVSTDATGGLVGRIKAFRHAAKAWSKQHRARLEELNNATFIVLLLDIYKESRVLSTCERWLRTQCRDRITLLIAQWASYWK